MERQMSLYQERQQVLEVQLDMARQKITEIAGKCYILHLLVITFYYILKRNHFGMTIVRVFVKIISIPDEELFFETAFGRTASYFV